jgi:iron complex transport system substrate-binding protein
VFGQASLVASVSRELGLVYQWHAVLPGKDFTHLQLTQLPLIDVDKMLIVQDPTQLGERMTSSPVWQHLPFVAEQQLEYVAPLWSFGGPISVIRMADEITQAMLNKTEP